MALAYAYVQFSPILTTAPSDFTLGVTFASNSFGYPTALALDGSGNAWISSQQTSSLPTGSVVEIANPTAVLSNNMTYPVRYAPHSEPYSIAVDGQSQNIWIGTGAAVEEFSSTGAAASGSPFLANDSSFVTGYSLNLDSVGNVWIAGYSSIYKLSAAGSVLSPSGGFQLPALSNAVPTALALDAFNNVWVTDGGNNELLELNPQGSVVTNLTNTADFFAPNDVAIDASNNAWVANLGSSNFTRYAPFGQPQLLYAPAYTSAPGTSNPTLMFVGIDGSGNSWMSLAGSSCSSNNTVCPGVAEVSGAGIQLSGPGFAIEGFQESGTPTASATAIDGSGDVWVVNTSANSVTELVGAATPVVTPLALAVSNNKLGVRP
jgi:streptogramin lyase